MGALSTAIVSQALVVAPAMASTSNEIESTAKAYLGTPYVWGGTSPSGFDCSGYIQYVFKQHGINLPRTASSQFNVGTSVSKANLQKGDLVFFETYKKGPSHVGIYLGGGHFINASSSKGVSIDSLNSSYWAERYIGAKRVLSGQSSASSSNHSSYQSVKKNSDNNDDRTVKTASVQSASTSIVVEEQSRLNADGKTYTVQPGDTLSHISSYFDVPVQKLKLLNEKEDNLINIGEKILVKGEPKLKVTLFKEEKTNEEKLSHISSYFDVPVQKLKLLNEKEDNLINIGEKILVKGEPKLKVTLFEEEKTNEEKEENIVERELDTLPVKDFEPTEQQKTMFENKPITKAEFATAIQYFVENNPSSIHLLKDYYANEVQLKDISDEHWAKSSIEWVVSNGFMKLDNNGEFHPEEEITVEDTDFFFNVLYKHHNLVESDIEYIQEQMDENEKWSYEYIERLIYNFSLELAADEEKQEKTKEQKENEEISPALFMAKERVEKVVTENLVENLVIAPLINRNIDETK